jgi:predicted DNA-binding transcriptional regulator AlpA
MELNDNLFKSNGISLSLRKASCPRRGLNREEAAKYIGVSPSFFDSLVKSGDMPKPVRMKSRTVWDRYRLDEYFEELSSPQDNERDALR